MSSSPDPSTPLLMDVGQIAVRAVDLPRAVAFYRDTLELPLLFQVPPGLAFFQCGSVRLMVSIPEPEFDHPSSILYFTVHDIEVVAARLLDRGVVFRSAPHAVHKAGAMELWMGFFADSEGNTLAIMESKTVG